MQSTCSHNQINAQNKIWFTRNLSHFECSTSFIALFEMKHDLLAFAKCKHKINYSCLQQLMVHSAIDAYSSICNYNGGWYEQHYIAFGDCVFTLLQIFTVSVFMTIHCINRLQTFFYHWTVLYRLRLSWLITGFLKHFV